ncbi:MAG: hypothetical protein J6L69_09625 [Lachnospiraceae bacterium]|nr:hypothetical protein [Lachnospiraceae bacterium]
MLKLTKYEFIKSRLTLIISAIIFALFEGYYLYSIITESTKHTAISTALLTFFGIASIFIVYIMAIVTYSKELSSKSSYLIFMTPNTPLNIIFSKMLSILVIGIGFIIVIATIAVLDVHLFFETYESTQNIVDFFKSFLEAMEINTAMIIPTFIVYCIEFMINFFSIVTMIYFAITLSATVLQNKPFKGFVSFALVIIFSLLMAKIEEFIPHIYEYPTNLTQSVISIVPTMAFEFLVMLACIFGTAKLLEKKVSL